jgi:signal peptidase II
MSETDTPQNLTKPESRRFTGLYKSMPVIILPAIIVLMVILDQITKFITRTSMMEGESFSVIGDFFRITYVLNPGMAFGIRMSNPVIFLGLSFVAAVLVFYYLYRMRHESWLLQVALSLISAGAVGNITDRFLYGQVVDFLDFEFFDIFIPAFNFLGMHFSGYSMTRWPVFNVADSCVTVGMTIVILHLILIGDPLKQPTRPAEG